MLFNQINSKAMSIIFNPTYATLSIGHFEMKLYKLKLYVCLFIYGEHSCVSIKENWNCFLDDQRTILRSIEISP